MTQIPVSLPASHPRVRLDLFRPSLSYPSYQYDEMLTLTARRFPTNEALFFQGVNLTYQELDALVNSLSNALLNLGLRRGQRICLFMKNCPEVLISWFAIARIGAIVSPINPSYKEREVVYQLNNSEAIAIIVQQELMPVIAAIRATTPALQHIIAVDGPEGTPAINPPPPPRYAFFQPDDPHLPRHTTYERGSSAGGYGCASLQ